MKGINALENAASEIRFGDNLTFAGAEKVNKTLKKVDDALGKTVAKVEGKVDGVLDDAVETISDETWQHINHVDKVTKNGISGGHNFDGLLTELQQKYGFSDDDVANMLVKSKEIIPPGGIHQIECYGPTLERGSSWKKEPLIFKRGENGELILKSSDNDKTVFDPAVYDPNAIRAGMDDALSKPLAPNPRKANYFEGVGKVVNKEGKTVEMNFEFIRDKKTGEIKTAYPKVEVEVKK